MAASAPEEGTPTPTCKGHNWSRAAWRTLWQSSLPTNRRRTSPTAIGLTPPCSLGRACKAPPGPSEGSSDRSLPQPRRWHKPEAPSAARSGKGLCGCLSRRALSSAASWTRGSFCTSASHARANSPSAARLRQREARAS